MSIVKAAAALIAVATLAGAAAPAYAQTGPAYGPDYRVQSTGGSWINSANRDYYSPGPATGGYAASTDGYASAECYTARVPVRLKNGRTVMRLRHVCP